MSMSALRTPSPALVVAFLAGLAAGVALAWLLEDRDRFVAPRLTADRDASPVHEHAPSAPTLHAGGREPTASPLPAETPARTADPLPPFEPPAELGLPPGVAGWIRVEVVTTPETEGSGGTVYALAAGAPGVEDIDLVPHGEAYADAPGRIAVARPGRYDVGLVLGEGHLLRRDVLVTAGETTTVVFQPPVPRRVHVVLEDPLPVVPGWSVLVGLQLGPVADGRVVSWPGRGEHQNRVYGMNLAPRTSEVGAFLPGERFTMRATLFAHRAAPKPVSQPVKGFCVVCEPAEIEGGDTVRLRIVPAGTLRLEATLDAGTWPAGVERMLDLEVRHPAGVHRIHEAVSQAGDPQTDGAEVYAWSFFVPAGAVEVRWSGADIEPDSLRGLVVRTGETTQGEFDMRFAGRARQLGRPLRIEVVWPEAREEDDQLQLAGAFRLADGRREVSTWSVVRGEGGVREPRMRVAAGYVGVIGRLWATGPLEVPPGETLRIRPVLGGLIVLAPEVDRPESMGRLLLRRPDGLPIPRPDEGFDLDVEARAGRVLGPFVPGEHAFQVWLGARRLPDVKVTVRAGRTAALVIPP